MRVIVAEDGSIRIPSEILIQIGAKPGDWVDFEIDGDRLILTFSRAASDTPSL